MMQCIRCCVYALIVCSMICTITLIEWHNKESRDNRSKHRLIMNSSHDNILPGLLLKCPWMKRNNTLHNYYTGHGKPLHIHTVDYMQVPKIASGTMKGCMRKIKKNMSLTMATFTYKDIPEKYMKYRTLEKPFPPLVLGGFSFGLADISNLSFAYFLVLREPYDRIISHYEHCRTRNTKDHICLHMNAKEVTVKQWAIHVGSYVFRQLFNNVLLCTTNYEHYIRKAALGLPYARTVRGELISTTTQLNMAEMQCWYKHKLYLDYYMTSSEHEAMLQYVLEHLEDWFTVVGLLNEYSMTLTLLQEAVKLPFATLCDPSSKHNENTRYNSTVTKTDMVDELRKQLINDNEVYKALYYDIRIYNKVEQIFHKQKTKYLEL
ncbi:uncharacterized protein LOC100371222 [Saccoglossus kowalevskii]|uniref:Uncharacterized protein LOC100371222 n=1 Tax=Saccoglossus kowalevskii TaxID=10224 RepID=A0ABM0GVL1_SACKO|nr:PREDICTED: uncharacterized protein LOC100371222 [Saccoglossus kowalevskii]